MSGAQIAKLASSFSLLLVVAVTWASSYREFARALGSATTATQVEKISDRFSDLLDNDEDLANAVFDITSSAEVDKVKRMVAVRAASEAEPIKEASSQAKEIKASPLYQDPGVKEQSNWLDGALKRLADLIPKQRPRSNISMPATSGVGWFIPVMWALLAAAVLIFGYFAIRHFSWKRALTRKAKTMLEDDEPERTLDEWLALADQHLAEGRYREAVRAMYLSCLLKFDEAGVARFVRGETNWEHLARITASSKKPADIDFRPPTQSFDRIWYGYHVKGREDVEQFRAWYQQIVESLRKVSK
jgi:hypothetical protein